MRPALVLCVLAACFHDPVPAPVASPARAPRVNPAVHDPLGFLPADAELVFSIDVAQLRASGLWTLVEPKLRSKAGEVLARFRAQCGVDPLRSIKQIAMGMRGIDERSGPSGVVVVRGMDGKALSACMDRLTGGDPRVTVAGDVVTVKAAPDESAATFTFAGATTLVAVISPTASPDELARVIQRGAPLRGSSGFVELVGSIETHHTAWFVLTGNVRAFAQFATMLGVRPLSFSGSIDLARGLVAAARLRLDSEDSAKHLAGLAQAQIGVGKGLFEELEVSADDADVVIRVVMSQTQLEMMIGMLGVFAGP